MARVTVEDCLREENNRFVLVSLASLRAKQLLAGQTSLVSAKKNKEIVSALREIAAGKVRFKSEKTEVEPFPQPLSEENGVLGEESNTPLN